VLTAGCASTDTVASDRAREVLQPPPATPSTTAPKADASNCTASLKPDPVLPAPMQMPARSWMAEIQNRGALRVGVDQNTLFFGYRNPRTNNLEGFDIDVAKEIARAIFGDPAGHIEYVVVSTSQRIPAVEGVPPGENVKVDMVASLMTMTCSRWDRVSFSSQYYDAAQGLLVQKSSLGDIAGPADLADKRVCATRGSTSSSRLQELQPKARMVEVVNRTECLVALQDGRVDAITADDTILYGFKKQDPTTVILPVGLRDEPYGLAMNKAHPDFVRFVNGVLERMRAEGKLAELESKWLRDVVTPPPEVPAASYRD
jgi:polar amino acid transport system substrate-binding protein